MEHLGDFPNFFCSFSKVLVSVCVVGALSGFAHQKESGLRGSAFFAVAPMAVLPGISLPSYLNKFFIFFSVEKLATAVLRLKLALRIVSRWTEKHA